MYVINFLVRNTDKKVSYIKMLDPKSPQPHTLKKSFFEILNTLSKNWEKLTKIEENTVKIHMYHGIDLIN